jgi:hypothetical protein
MSEAAPVVLERFRSKFTRNCDKFSFAAPTRIDLARVVSSADFEVVSVKPELGMASCLTGQVKVSVFEGGKVVLKGTKDVEQAARAAEAVLRALGFEITLKVAAEDRTEY